jgi:hypothetical protein
MANSDSFVQRKVFAMTGMPRSGTTYLSAVLHDSPRVVTQSEAGGAWKRLFREHGADANPLSVFDERRDEMAAGQPVATLECTPAFAGNGRVDTWNQKKISRGVAAEKDFVLGMKNPEVFLAWLGRFVELGVRCVISIRHPVEIINSWVKRARLGDLRGQVREGTFANGDCVTFRASADNAIERRIELHNHFAAQIIEHVASPLVMLAHYDHWFTDSTQLNRLGRFLDVAVLDRLRPTPIPPDPIELPRAECDLIQSACVIAAELGIPKRGGVLLPPISHQR